MIRVRYRGSNDLSPGLHATAERDGRRTTVYLLDGMTTGQRRSALRRLRLTARMGHCPRLPAAQLALALFTDRIRTGVSRAGAVMRLHPAGSTVPIMVLSGGAIAFLLFSTVSIHVLHGQPRNADQSASGLSPVVTASATPASDGSQDQASGPGSPGSAGGPGATGGPAGPGGLGGGSDPRQLTQPGHGSSGRTPALAAAGGGEAGAGSGGAGSGGSGSGNNGSGGGGSGGSGSGGGTRSNGKSSGGTSGGTTDSGGTNPSQVPPQQSTPATSAPAPAPATTAPGTTSTQPSSGSSSGSQGNGVCLNVGPLGVCLNI